MNEEFTQNTDQESGETDSFTAGRKAAIGRGFPAERANISD